VALNLLTLLRKIDSLLLLEAKHGEALRTLSAEVDRLKGRVASLEAREDVLVARSQGAAAAAAATVSANAVSDLARRIGMLEERSRHPRLPPPEVS